MKLIWQIDVIDVEKVMKFVELHKDNVIVRRRRAKNLADNYPFPKREDIWEAIVACLLTTQQKSGPEMPVSKFLRQVPFPLSLESCMASNVQELTFRCLKAQRGMQRFNLIAEQLKAVFEYLEPSGWSEVEAQLQSVYQSRTPESERIAARFIDLKLRGFGPKQSRNLLQKLGLSRHEIPIDSRITKWLNENLLFVPLPSPALSIESYYELLSDGIQALCEAANIKPCIFDAAIFASYDGAGWTEENAIW